MPAAERIVAVVVAALVVSIALTASALAYARRRGLLDLPGQRRSHHVPTPRGGGVGIVAAWLLVGAPTWFGLGAPWSQAGAFVVAVLAVALVGWRDDHAPLPVWPRLAVHAFAALLIAIAVLAPVARAVPVWWWALLALVPVFVGFINAHNFMDGIDGILGQQGLCVLAGLGVLAAYAAAPALAALAFVGAAGCVGFLAFNFPPAKIFMGDVGSGALGLTLAAVAAFLVQRQPALFWACAILPSAFLVDSGLTLAHRVLAGERWYAPHRQHLYQWLVRVNWSHARTDATYLAWNLVIVAPLTGLAARWPERGVWCCVAAYVAAACVWYVGKRRCLAVVRRSDCREAA
ncbi:MAG TPA: glycosyltransferase family 4 protein [Rhodanobacteraceae bacterium]